MKIRYKDIGRRSSINSVVGIDYCCTEIHDFLQELKAEIAGSGLWLGGMRSKYCPLCGTRIIVEEKNKV